MTREEATEKIRKLLQRNGRTEAEADTAQIIAAAIAEKHGIDIAQIDQAEEQRKAVLSHEVVGEWAKLPCEAEYASLICKRFFEVSAFTQSGWTDQMVFVGTEWHLQVAEYVFGFLIQEFRWLWNRRRGRCRNRKQFIYGCFIAVFRKLEESFQTPTSGMDLQVSMKAKRDAYIKEAFGDLTQSSAAPKGRRSAATQYGYMAGRDIEIRPGVAAGRPVQKTCLPGLDGRLLTNG